MTVIEIAKSLFEGDNKFYPGLIHYIRLGRKSQSPVKFTQNQEGVSLKKLTWNEKKLNLSLLTQVYGRVELDEDAPKYGFSGTFPTYSWKNFTIIRDGELNMEMIPVSLDEKTYNTFKENGVVTEDWVEGKVFEINLKNFPIISDEIINLGITDGKELAELAVKEQYLQAAAKAVRYYIKKYDTENSQFFKAEILTEEQEKYLEKFYIGKNGFSPVLEKEGTVETYETREFEIKVAKMSSLPKVEVVEEKVKQGKKLTLSEEAVYNGIKITKQIMEENANLFVKFLKLKLESIQLELKEIKDKLQYTKFAVLLGGKEISGLSDDSSIEVDGKKVTFSVKTVTVSK